MTASAAPEGHETQPERSQPAQLISTAPTTGRLQRRRVLVGVGGMCAVAVEMLRSPEAAQALTEPEWSELVKSGKLTREAYNVLHNASTERPFTSALNTEKRVGVFNCAACSTPLFDSATKFDSGTGWPSFFQILPGVETEKGSAMDRMVLMRKEVHCNTCKGHLGHVFEDGWIYPDNPTGLRYCINGVSLAFAPAPGQPAVSPKEATRMTEFGRVPTQG